MARISLNDGVKLNIGHVREIKAEVSIGTDGLNTELNFRDAHEAIRGIISLLDQFRNMPEIDALVQSKEAIPLRDMLVWLLEEKFGLRVKEN